MFTSTRALARMLVALTIGVALAAGSQAGTPDRIYLFGDDPDENPTLGGTPSSNFGSLTLDSQIMADNFSDASDLSFSGSPTYFNAGSGGLARPGAAAGTFGLQFNGAGDLLFRTLGGLGSPAVGDNNYTGTGAPVYTGITTRYIDGWVRPTGGSGTRRDIINDTTQFGIFISPDDTWGFVQGGATVVSSTPAALNQWSHVMHRTFGSTGGAALYVNGVAVAATSAGYDTGAPADDLVIAANLAQTSNHFQGQLDDFVIGVAGDNTGQGGQNWGPLDLAQDNDYIRQALDGFDPADMNLNGSVGQHEIDTLVGNWLREFEVDGMLVGDLNSRAMGDLNMNGIVDIGDAFLLHFALRQAGGAGLDFSLLGTSQVPEPSSVVLLLGGLVALAGMRQRRRVE